MVIFKTRNEIPDKISMALENANVFYGEEYEKYTMAKGDTALYVADERCIQIITLHTIKHFFTVVHMPSEPFIYDKTESCNLQVFIDDVIRVLKKLKADWLSITPAYTSFDVYPTSSKRIRFGNYITDLKYSEEEIFGSIHRKHRNMIRRGEKGEVTIVVGHDELIEDYLVLDKQTWDRSQRDTSNRMMYEDYLKYMPESTVIAIAYKDGIPQGGIFGLYNKRMFYYMFGATADNPEPGATHYLHWQMMRFLKSEGVESYNFVGCRINVNPNSKYQHIQHFKKGFGGVLKESYLFRSTINRAKKYLFDTILKITHRKSSDIIDQEIHKWKDINV